MDKQQKYTENKSLIQNESNLPKTYFDLIEKIGSKGKYQ
jgi:hypothetical protein